MAVGRLMPGKAFLHAKCLAGNKAGDPWLSREQKPVAREQFRSFGLLKFLDGASKYLSARTSFQTPDRGSGGSLCSDLLGLHLLRGEGAQPIAVASPGIQIDNACCFGALTGI